MAISVVSGASNTILTVDPASNAARATLYDTAGNPMSDVLSLAHVLNALNADVTVVLGGQATLGINVQSTSGTLTLSFEASIDGTNWFAISATPVAGGATVSSTTTDGNWVAPISGYQKVRTRISAFTSGSMTVSVAATPSTSPSISQIVSSSTIATAANQTTLGAQTTKINDGTNTATVTGANALKVDGSAVTQPISAATLPLPTGAATSANQTTLGNQTTKINDGTNTATVTAASALKVDGSAVTQPISAASLPLPSGAATSANQTTLGNQTTKINDGTNTAAVKAASTAATATDPSLVVAVSPNTSVLVQGTAADGATPVGNPVLSAGFDGTNVQTLLTDTAGRQIVVGGAAAGAAIAGNPVLSGGSDGTNARALLTDTSGRQVIQGAIADRSTMVAGTQPGVPILGQSSAVGRIARVRRTGHLSPGGYQLQALDVIEGTNINSWLWTTSATTMTQTQTTGILTQNANATTTNATFAILTTIKQFGWISQSPIGASFKANVSQTTNAVNEMGFGAPSGTTAIINNGAFFRVTTSGQVVAVTSFNGTETVSATLATLSSTSYYLFYVWIEDGGARFIIEDNAGVPLVDFFAQLTLTTPDVIGAISHLPAFSRVYTNGTAGTAPTTKIGSFQVWGMDIDFHQSWAEQLAGSGRSSNIDPTTFAQTQGLAAAAAPSATAPTNTTVKYTNLGGEYAVTMTAASENLLGVFGYTVPAPYTFYITDIFIPPAAITTAFGATATVIVWSLQVANSTNPSTATGPRYGLGTFSALASAAVGTTLAGAPISLDLMTPIAVLPGQVVLITLKVVVGIATGVYRGICNINGYFA